MLLKYLYDFAQSKRLLDDLAFERKAVRWVIELDSSGRLLGDGPQMTGDDKRGKEYLCPQTTRQKVAGGVSEFLADGLTAIFGLDTNPDNDKSPKARAARNANNAAKHADFWGQIAEAEKATKHPGLQAVLTFRQLLSALMPTLLRWGKSPDAKETAKSAWWLRTASGGEMRVENDNFTFRVNGELLLENEDLRQFWRKRHAQEVNTARNACPRGLCLVSGCEDQPIAPTHNPKIQGVPNTAAFGAAIVSFDKSAFASYGFDQSFNAPTSENAATAYCVALNWMLQRKDYSLRLGQTSLCFWTRQTESVVGLFAHLLEQPDPQSVSNFLKSPWIGIERELAKKDLFFSVMLAGNAGRIVIRHWFQEPLDQAIDHFHHWFSDLELQVPARPQPMASKQAKASNQETKFHALSIYWLACATVREAKDLAPDVSAQLYRAALQGAAPSVSIIKPILNQLHSRLVRDENYNLIYDQSRFALLKLILNRNRKESCMEIRPELTADTNDPAYNCGRLLAILAATQAKAHKYKLEGPGIAERYFGTASVSPSSVFPLLLRLNRHHLSKIGKSARYAGHERFITEQIQQVMTLFKPASEGAPPMFPRTLDLQAQGRFALGFYQQMASDEIARQEGKAKQHVLKNTATSINP